MLYMVLFISLCSLRWPTAVVPPLSYRRWVCLILGPDNVKLMTHSCQQDKVLKLKGLNICTQAVGAVLHASYKA